MSNDLNTNTAPVTLNESKSSIVAAPAAATTTPVAPSAGASKKERYNKKSGANVGGAPRSKL